MKSTKILFTSLGAVAAMSIAAFAGDLAVVQVSNGHGQITPLYRSNESSIAVFSDRGLGQGSSSRGVQTESKDNAHGQSVIMYRQVQ